MVEAPKKIALQLPIFIFSIGINVALEPPKFEMTLCANWRFFVMKIFTLMKNPNSFNYFCDKIKLNKKSQISTFKIFQKNSPLSKL